VNEYVLMSAPPKVDRRPQSRPVPQDNRQAVARDSQISAEERKHLDEEIDKLDD
jgi:hypothetical protein